ncbi:sulfide/dihydroorotate dehydrogenase-like FAD/NAD-binding protein [Alkaliphilus pronyensis]|uniref:Sulfide/dihydroorotate dehydrogenase-like FAD/NAD-binding protein n=1 Tax=Alkaliphilus pronyensis TaxID=1482732 RepID=A0A6I0F6C0_9FIRM|nr:sulfide/dihydroorotate dehydrogenase-like FAD/NAD-binding protein [Alkaliphilus pronyensis]KAB3532543.1 sulfide/dihydroorotate dehydrogenase-like FAD/NAD-binding protein [Alkaliphilus pronyensis]
MNIEGDQCIDAGSEYCPCYLAEMNSCITCSRLRGKDYCDCNWPGLCIYQEFHFLNQKKKNIREARETLIIDKEIIEKNIIIFTLEVPHSLARQLKQPGSYIFIRNKDLEGFFDIPISIMDANEHSNYIKIAVEIQGVKTQAIKEVNDSLLIRGPYWNGIFGLENLKKAKGKSCLIIARGIAQAPAILTIKHLLHNNNIIDVIVDKASSNINLISEYTMANLLEDDINFYSREGQEKINLFLSMKKYDLVFIGGSDYLQKNLFKNLNLSEMKIVVTNNNELCCGEGICGACVVYDAGGIPIRSCKTQVNYKK